MKLLFWNRGGITGILSFNILFSKDQYHIKLVQIEDNFWGNLL